MAASTIHAPISKTDRDRGYRLGSEGWATKREAATLLRLSERTIERLLDAGKIRGMKLDADSDQSLVRICRRSVAMFVAAREATGPT